MVIMKLNVMQKPAESEDSDKETECDTEASRE
jgi:hypothetical protein